MQSIDQFFDLVERGEHALVSLNPHFVLLPIYTRIMLAIASGIDEPPVARIALAEAQRI
jgi:hypothetical protein